MYHFIVLAYLAVAASATSYFLTVFAPGTEVDGAIINAAGNGFYLSLDGPSTYCPTFVKDCPVVQGTLVKDDLTAMAVEVPGGQQIYTAADGEVRFMSAHSNQMSPGATVGGWFNETVVAAPSTCASGDDAAQPPRFVFDFQPPDRSGAGGVKICPDVPQSARDTGAGYALYVGTRAFNQSFCVDAVGLNLVPRDVEVGAYQYN
ncbi:hypothetical protein GGR52DRAFT_493622 [Hypoxylon sp. FL1284]|nr:hypothetical protein GGR52DRAFT_493622 [Hypoxylon sp. FL1284]